MAPAATAQKSSQAVTTKDQATAVATKSALPSRLEQTLKALTPQIAQLLPPDIQLEQFRAALWVHLQEIKGLMDCHPTSLRKCVVQAANNGLLPGRDCNFLPFKGKAVFCPHYQGLIRALDRTGKVADSFAHPVYVGDTFEIDFLANHYSHKPALGQKRGELRFFYSCIIKKDGTKHIEIMTLDEIEAVRRRSPAADEGPWVTDFVAMGRKTALKQGCKYVQLTPEVREAIFDEDQLPPGAPSNERAQLLINELYGDKPQERHAVAAPHKTTVTLAATGEVLEYADGDGPPFVEEPEQGDIPL
jgi:recombination protein RecT